VAEATKQQATGRIEVDRYDTVSGEWFVIPNSGSGGLERLRGEDADFGQGAEITLDYWFE
jgi:hypothetical protein